MTKLSPRTEQGILLTASQILWLSYPNYFLLLPSFPNLILILFGQPTFLHETMSFHEGRDLLQLKEVTSNLS